MSDEANIPDALPEGFGEDVSVDADAPHPNKQQMPSEKNGGDHQGVFDALAEAGAHECMRLGLDPARPLGAQINFGPPALTTRDMTYFATGLSNLIADVRMDRITFHPETEVNNRIKGEVLAEAQASLLRIVVFSDPSALPIIPGGNTDE